MGGIVGESKHLEKQYRQLPAMDCYLKCQTNRELNYTGLQRDFSEDLNLETADSWGLMVLYVVGEMDTYT